MLQAYRVSPLQTPPDGTGLASPAPGRSRNTAGLPQRQRTFTLGLGTNTMRSSRVLSFVSAAALLAACGGSNTGPSNSSPTADFTAPTCTVNVSCSFAGTGTDTDGSIASYSWDFGDQTPAVSGQNVTHTFTTANTFQVKLTVADNAGATGSVTKP